MSNDLTLQQAVIDELTWDPEVSAAHIGVTAHKGIVTLSGHVPTYFEKEAASRAAARVKGVRAVAEELKVELLGNPVADERLAADALSRLGQESSLPKERIQVQVEDGHVTLTGNVDWKFQKDAAQHALARLPGVKWVSNRIELSPPTVASDVRQKIEKALQRIAPFDAESIVVKDVSGKITLSGEVGSLYERDLVENAAWSVPGVRDVKDEISVVY